MGLFAKFQHHENAPSTGRPSTEKSTENNYDAEKVEMEGPEDHSHVHRLTLRTFFMGLLVSMGGFIFGYDTGQISGFLEMKDFLKCFGQYDPKKGYYFSNVRAGLIVALLSIGTLIGALMGAPVADRLGRRLSISFWSCIFAVGVVVQISTDHKWYQVAVGRLVAGFGVGALSVLVPMFQSESAPRQVRGALISAYQLFITLGIFTANCINFGTEKRTNTGAWRIPMGVGWIWALILGIGVLFFPETPRFDFRHGRVEKARHTMAKLYGVPLNHREINREMREIKEKHDIEHMGGAHPWYEIFTGPRMAYRTLLGIALQALQQLTGANFFFYYGTSIFTATGIKNSYVTQMILGGVNFGTTFGGLYVVEHFGRRKSLIIGALWMFVCFMIFASVGHFALDRANPPNTPHAGAAMIVFACLFITGFAMTWGPIVWAIVGEMYPMRYRAKCMGIATASNWTWNFLISFFTPFITPVIDFRYGYVFASCCFLGAVVVYFFVCESQGKTLEEIDTMYILHVKPWESSKWIPPDNEDLVTADRLNLEPGARSIRKNNEAGGGGVQQLERGGEDSHPNEAAYASGAQ
ncbi:putative MFS monosaccharide transporter [Xylona heveae TC161]|uniref:Putative MFS monosaccharide transporter n=1 Tax=Xylona heveae (strain CBS 132557 / TC161) TaxID=1328760 RepID=A0A165J6Z1_XYLHT|nr:putative MFS monosaccharide transporter [Xylona heveae TC161]KZF25822.1 putative MFS monosaccharide transporter [Xylona heveae TC161]